MLKKFRIVYHLTNTYIVSKLAAWLDLKYTFLFIFSKYVAEENVEYADT